MPSNESITHVKLPSVILIIPSSVGVGEGVGDGVG